MNEVKEKWPEIIEHLRVEHELLNVSFNTWIKPLKVYDVIDDTAYILVNKDSSVEYIDKKYRLPLMVCIAEITGKEYEIQFVSEDDDKLNEIHNASIDNGQKKKTKSLAEKAGLNPKYTFDTFVVGGNNNFAHAASLAVAESPGEVYNPLFLYGGVGLGKTHLMHSIAHFILDKNPKKKVLYVTSETFTNELIDALRNGKTAGNESAMLNFRDKYRNIDVLLIDDIQFIIGKESTQEEFFHTFNHLHTLGKQIIISSDKPPKDIETLESRLRTRFEWGLIADISSPDYETRMAILQKKIELDHLEKYNIKNDVLDYIAANVKSNIRELEGSLNNLIALYKLINNNNPIDIALAAEALKDIIAPDEARPITPEVIIETVTEHYNYKVTKDDILGKNRSRDISYPRQICMYLCEKYTGLSLAAIGAALGNKDHTTVLHGIKKIKTDLEKDEQLRSTIDIITKKLNPPK